MTSGGGEVIKVFEWTRNVNSSRVREYLHGVEDAGGWVFEEWLTSNAAHGFWEGVGGR